MSVDDDRFSRGKTFANDREIIQGSRHFHGPHLDGFIGLDDKDILTFWPVWTRARGHDRVGFSGQLDRHIDEPSGPKREVLVGKGGFTSIVPLIC